MDLPGIFKKEKTETEYLWSLTLGRNWVDSAIWTVIDNTVQVVAFGGATTFTEGDENSLLESADASLSNAASHLPPDAKEPSKVVFGLPFSWLEQGDIKPQHLDTLKRLSKELELTPSGFVTIPEAIVHFLKTKEGTPPNVILVGISEEYADISLVQSGKIIGSSEVARSVSLGADVAEGLARLENLSQYPTRILVYNHKASNIEQAKDNLLETDWDKVGLSFLHTPKVEVLAEDSVVSAVTLAGGAEVGGATNLVIVEPAITSPNIPVQSAEEFQEELQEEEIELQKEEVEDSQIIEPEEVEIEEENPLPGKEHENVQAVNPEDIGFTSGNITPLPRPTPPPAYAIPTPSSPPVREVPRQENPLLQNLSAIGSLFKNPFRSNGYGQRSKLNVVWMVGLLALLLFGLAYWFLPQARVTVYVAPQRIDQQLDFKVDTSTSSVDTGSKTIPGRFVEIEETINKSTQTTGNKNVGDKAKGEVTVYRVGGAVTLPKGTTLTGNNLKFTLDDDVRVASGSAGPDTLGKNTSPAKVTAFDIGQDYNLPSNTTFKIGTYSTEVMTAKNSQALTGGTKREITAISKADIDSLTKDAKSALISQAQEKIKDQVGAEEILLTGAETTSITDEEFSGKVNDEADSVSVDMTGKVKFLIVSKEHLKDLVTSQTSLPEGFSLKADQLQVEVREAADDEYTANVKANLLPKVNPEDLVSKIAGKSPSKAKDYLAETPGFTRAEIAFKFQFPSFLGTLPRLKKNISVEIVAER